MAGRRGRALLAVLAVAGLLAASAIGFAEEWGGIEPGVTTLEQVRARYGAPSREMRAKVDNYDTVQWIWGNRSPAGFQRMTADYGLLTPQGYKPTVVACAARAGPGLGRTPCCRAGAA
jgi:hypothetical protein